MAFSMQCSNKGCGQIQEPYLDPNDNKVYCSKCDKEIVNVTDFTRRQLKSLKQFRQKKTTSFAVKCNKCNKEERPKIINNDVYCSQCNKKMDNLSEPFKLMLKEKLKTADKDI